MLRSRPHRRPRLGLLAVLAMAAACVVAPGSALAVEALPDAIEDPPAAFEPEVEVDAGAEAPSPEAEVAGVADPDPAPTVERVAGVSAAPKGPAPTGGGSLPFTGIADGQLTLLFLVGSLLVLGGATTVAHARAAADAR